MDPILIIILALAALLVILLLVVLIRTANFPLRLDEVAPANLPEVDGEMVAQRIGLAVQYKTIANVDPEKIDPLPFEGLHRLLETLYPLVHNELKREVINRHALLYTWQGTDPSLDPVLFMAHQDVVPADENPDSGWTHPPFSGKVADGYVWGRGTIDIKNSLIGIFEAATALLREGYKPLRTIYLAFGHDEEVSGIHGSHAIAELLKERGVHLACLLDEGGSVLHGFLPQVSQPVAMLGISEKGYLSLKLKSKVLGGHSSMPPDNTAIGLLSLSIAALEANPMPSRLEVIQFMMSHLGKAIPFSQRMALANPWLFGRTLERKISADPATNASIRTTTAPTIFHSGATENVLPPEAEAVVNFRLMPGDTIKDVYEHVVDVIGDERISVSPLKGETLASEYGWNPTPVADTDSPQFERMFNLVRAAFPEALATPFLVVGATDARHYADICQNAFRFSPVVLTREELGGMHGVNERLSIENAARMVGFYIECMREMASLGADHAPARVIEAPAPHKHKTKENTFTLPDLPAEEELVVKPLKKD